MKTLQNVFMATLVAGFSLNASAQSIKDMIDAGTYYEDENYIWYEFIGDNIDSEYDLWEPVSTELVNGWKLGYPMDTPPAECTISLDTEKGLVTKVPFVTNDNAYTSASLKLGTPKVHLNTQDYPILAIKFSHFPTCGEGGWQADNEQERMYGGTRLQVVERKETNASGTDSDFWLRIPRNVEDANEMMSLKEDDWQEWLTIYSPTNADATFESTDAVYIFNLEGAVTRNHANKVISSIKDACIDLYLMSVDILDDNDYLAVEWVRSFYDVADAIEYADDLYLGETGIDTPNQSNIKVLSENGKIIVNGIENPSIEIYNLQGQKVATETTNEIALTNGLYIVNIISGNSTQTFKVLNK